MYCKQCGAQQNEGERYCHACGSKQDPTPPTATPTKARCLPSFILGLIGSLFGIFGGLCTTMCDSLFHSGVAPFILIFGGSILGLIGACKCLSNAKSGSILELIGAAMIVICAYFISGAEIMSILAWILLLAGGLIGIVYSLIKKK